MSLQLSPLEIRVIGCLMEKQVTTPEQYPLSLNALQSACNQKSNRDPVMELSEQAVQATVDALARRHLVLERSGFGSRVPKYQQRLCNTEFSTLQLSAQERAVLCELMVRGAQTAGELRSRAARMASFADVSEVERTLEALMQRTPDPLVVRLGREAGRRELRYAHRLGAVVDETPGEAPEAAPASTASAAIERVEAAPPAEAEGTALRALEARVQNLEREVARLSGALEAATARGGSSGPPVSGRDSG
ncbi:MAG TPA: DUF480 domain-containing protein [Steroidobacteraceae bacterium]|nr:DUF480 domain-containing protein [Steroidobacteraceae bacterium]